MAKNTHFKKNLPFALALSQAIEHIARQEGRLIGAIDDELGHALGTRGGGKTLQYWKAGAVPKTPSLRALVHVLLERGVPIDLTRTLLQASDRLDAEWLLNSINAPDSDKGASQRLQAVRKPIADVVGRDDWIEQICNVLTDSSHAVMAVGIDGLGGIGKTALARAAADRCLATGLFERVIEISAQRVAMSWWPQPDAGLTVAGLFEALAMQLSLAPIERITLPEQALRIQEEMRSRRILLLLDNLETAGEPQEQLVGAVLPLLGESRALMTSRRRFSERLFHVHLAGLDAEAAHQLAQHEGRLRNIVIASGLSDAAANRIHTVAGGAPLAIQLVIGQMGHLDLDRVMGHLKQARPIRKDRRQDEYAAFYRHLYAETWRLLDAVEQSLLIAMSMFAPGLGADAESISAVSHLPDMVLTESLDALWRSSLLEVGWTLDSDNIHARYSMHPLTHHFVHSDLMEGAF